jgi:acetyl-CoA synthetase
MDRTTGRAAYRASRDILVRHRDDYHAAVAAFRWPDIGDRFNWALDWFDPIATGNPRTALRIIGEDGSDHSYSFAELAARSDRLATSLAAGGVAPGHRVMVMLGNQVELWESMLAVMKLGAVIMPATTALGPNDLADRVARGAVRHVITNADQVDKFADTPGDFGRIAIGDAPPRWRPYRLADAAAPPSLVAQTRADDPMLIYFTSGTTRRPKLVEHTHRSYPVGHLSTMYFLGLRRGDVHLNISSPGWAKHAWSSFFAPWIAGSTILVYDCSRFDASRFLTMLGRAGVTSVCAPPTVWRMLIQAQVGAKPPVLREVVSAGEPLNPEVIEQVQKHWGLTVRDGFGQTETTALIGNTPGSPVKPGSMGRPLPGVAVEIVDSVTGQPASEGEVCLRLDPRPVNLMAGYLGDDESNDDLVSARGYYHTGDVASRDADGYITYIGRTDDVFKASDYKISPFELESVLIEHPAVVEAAVVPAPDPTRLAVPKAYISLAAGWSPNRATADEIFAHAHRNLAPYQRIRRIEFMELPKTISGKIRRVDLRARENACKPDDLTDEYRDR